MAQYLIHAMPKRIWYVNEYLIPSMIEQGIKAEDIRVYNDEKREGNLKACMKAYEMCEGDGGTWHLQDDVCISSSFKALTEKYDTGIVCGFKSEYDGTQMPGIVPVQNMWFSFPCIRIPNSIAREVAKWVQKQMCAILLVCDTHCCDTVTTDLLKEFLHFCVVELVIFDNNFGP